MAFLALVSTNCAGLAPSAPAMNCMPTAKCSRCARPNRVPIVAWSEYGRQRSTRTANLFRYLPATCSSRVGRPTRLNETIWRLIAKLIHSGRCWVGANFQKMREVNGNSSKRIILYRKIHLLSESCFHPDLHHDPTRPECRPSGVCPLLRSLLGVKRTCLFALHMSAYDPKRTLRAAQRGVHRPRAD